MTFNFATILSLLEDPNEEVFEALEPAILENGSLLENDIVLAIENNTDVLIHKRLIQIHKKIRYHKIGLAIKEWFLTKNPPISEILILIDKIQNVDYQNELLLHSFLDQLKRNVWIELNNYLTPLEQINVINSIIYNYYGLGTDDLGTTVFDAKTFFLSNIYQDKIGNRFSIAALYLFICEAFDISIQTIYLDNQELYLAYFSAVNFELQDFNISLYINPSNGGVFTQMEVISMLKSQDINIDPEQFKPLNIKQLFALLLKQLQFSYIVEQDFIAANFLKELLDSIKEYSIIDNDSDYFD